ncbi:hypothetical protein GCM10017688_07000 [Streptomyces ramulosus]
MRSQATNVLVSAVWSRSSASLGSVSDRAARISTGPRARTYDENDGYDGRAAVGCAGSVHAGVVMSPR